MKHLIFQIQLPRWIFFLTAISFAAFLPVSQAHAMSSYLNTWNGIYPGSSSGNNASCQLCHGTSTGNLNAYGAAICAAGGNITARIQAVHNPNSDQDPTGASNITEINASTQPGWTPGNVNPLFNFSCNATGTVTSPPGSISGQLDPPLANLPPVANPNGPYTGTVGVAVQFNGSASTDPNGTITAYNWNFGDGTSGTGVNPTHTYSAAGSYTVSLTVTDNAGLSNSASTSATIGVGNQAPVANANGPYTGAVGTPVQLNGSASVDPDGSIISYSWNFGDGSSGSGVSPSHVYLSQGTFNVTLTVMDNTGATDSASTTATIGPVPNQPPTANPNGPYTGSVGVPVQFDGSGSTDPEGASLSYAWNFGDGGTATGATPTHTYNTDGLYTVSLTVTDPAGLSNTAATSASIGPVANQPPTADANGPYSGTINQAVQFNGSGSTDPEGGPLSYVWNFGDGSSGTGATPTHSYASNGVYTVNLVVTDNAGASDSATTTATIGVGNLPPNADANGPYTGSVGVPVQFNGAGSNDPDGSIAAYNWDFGDGSRGTGVNPSHTYSAAGTFNVTLTVSDNAGTSDSASTSATITPAAPPPNENVDLDIDELGVSRTHILGRSRPINISLEVRNRGTVDAPRLATVVGTQNGREIYRNSMLVSAAVGRGDREFRFPSYTPSSLGTLQWLATINDNDPDADQATTSTRVVSGARSNRDHDESSNGNSNMHD